MSLKISVIGSGGWGNRVVRKLHGLCGVHLVYGHKNREQLQKDLGVNFTEDIDELIKQSDAVVVAAPPMVHYELGKKILKAKKDLWMEKPMAMSSPEAAELAKMADESNLIILVGHLLCYSQNMKEFKKAGSIKSARGIFLKTSSEEKVLNSYWNLGIHLVALAVLLDIDMDKFSLETSHSALKEERTFTIETEDGKSITWDILSPDQRQDMLLEECKHFLECIQTRKQPLTNGWHGVEVMKVMEKLWPNPFQD